MDLTNRPLLHPHRPRRGGPMVQHMMQTIMVVKILVMISLVISLLHLMLWMMFKCQD